MKNILSPSILSADFANLGEGILKTQKAGAEYLHFDVMDGVFVPSISFGMPVLKAVKKCTEQVLDVHLMITEPVRYVEEFKNAGADMITFHYEACEDVQKTVDKIKELGIKVGIALCPETPVDVLTPFLEQIDMVLIMTVHPGFGGQKLIPETLDKVKEVREMLNEKNLETDIQVDGGIYAENIKLELDAGANVFVSGSGVFKGNIEENTKNFMEILNSYE